MKITAVVLTKNEEKNIEKCLNSILFCDEIIIIDDFSTDNTKNKILNIKNQNDKLNIKIIEHKLSNDFTGQRNFGLERATNEWVLFIDADEVVTNKLKNEILGLDFPEGTIALLRGNDNSLDSFYLRRRDFFWNQELKYGEVKKVREQGIVRLVKKNSGKWLGDVHEVFHTASNIGSLNGFINHFPHQTLKEFINDINRYSDIRADELFNRSVNTNIFEIIFLPIGKFLFNFLFNLGFLDGAAGFTYAFMMSFHSFLVRAKLYQLIHKK